MHETTASLPSLSATVSAHHTKPSPTSSPHLMAQLHTPAIHTHPPSVSSHHHQHQMHSHPPLHLHPAVAALGLSLGQSGLGFAKSPAERSEELVSASLLSGLASTATVASTATTSGTTNSAPGAKPSSSLSTGLGRIDEEFSSVSLPLEALATQAAFLATSTRALTASEPLPAISPSSSSSSSSSSPSSSFASCFTSSLTSTIASLTTSTISTSQPSSSVFPSLSSSQTTHSSDALSVQLAGRQHVPHSHLHPHPHSHLHMHPPTHTHTHPHQHHHHNNSQGQRLLERPLSQPPLATNMSSIPDLHFPVSHASTADAFATAETTTAANSMTDNAVGISVPSSLPLGCLAAPIISPAGHTCSPATTTTSPFAISFSSALQLAAAAAAMGIADTSLLDTSRFSTSALSSLTPLLSKVSDQVSIMVVVGNMYR
ncbi:unnamed protein product [Protopolystoma xenopodis]|uniref:Uncharacterized protein n=1 Tax=Protopolystoma xenopodis TaxID=117903 RepID=A0A3S5BBC0_9PLAT|nr:unnamed protein product [Protopolystoma xenopodis]